MISFEEALSALENADLDMALLAEIATHHPSLRPAVRQHPQAYPGLVEWIDSVSVAGDVTGSPGAASITTWIAEHRRTLIIAGAALAATGAVSAAIAVPLALTAPDPGASVNAAPVATASATPRPAPTVAEVVRQPEVLPDGDWNAFGPGYVPRGFNEGNGRYAVVGPALFYLPGLGAVEFDVTEARPQTALLQQLWSLTEIDGEPHLVGAIRERIAAQGLDPESFLTSVAVVDPVTRDIVSFSPVVSSTDEYLEVTLVIGGPAATAAIGFDDNRVMGVDLRDGSVRWERGGFGSVGSFGTIIMTAYSDEIGLNGVPCGRISAINIADGGERWYVDAREEEYQDGRCRPLDINYSSFSAGYSYRPYPGGYVQVQVGDGFRNSLRTDRGYDLATGTVRIHRDRLIAFDGQTDLAVRAPDESGRTGIEVWNTLTGEVVYTIDGPRAEALDLRIVSFIDGVLYGTTSDESIAIDVATGELLPVSGTAYPVSVLNGWVQMSDNRIIPVD